MSCIYYSLIKRKKLLGQPNTIVLFYSLSNLSCLFKNILTFMNESGGEIPDER